MLIFAFFMEIRNLNRNDFDQVINLLVTSFSSRYNHPLINENLNNPNTICLVAEIDNVIIGVASLHIIEKLTRKMGLIEDVAVDLKYRGKGIGKKLIQKLIVESKKQGCDKTVLNSTQNNVPFYEKIGFTVNELQMVLRNN